MVTIKRFSAAKWDALTEDEMLDQAYLRSQYRRGISDAEQYAHLVGNNNHYLIKDPRDRMIARLEDQSKRQSIKAHSGITSLNRAKEDLSRMSNEERNQLRKRMKYALAEHMGYSSPEDMAKYFDKTRYADAAYREAKKNEYDAVNTVGGIGLGMIGGGVLGAAIGKDPAHAVIGGFGGAILGGYLGNRRKKKKIKELMSRELTPEERSLGKAMAYNIHASL